MSKIETLLRYLRNQNSQEFIAAKKLASILGVTDRTIRSYIKKINNERPNLIQSSRDGYRLNLLSDNLETFKEEDDAINNRRFYILRRLFKSMHRGVDLYDLADSLYVSDATIRTELSSLSAIAKDYGLKIVQKENRYLLRGPEKNKRDLMMELVKEQNTQGASFKEDIQKFLGDLNLKEVMAISRKVFNAYEITINTYFFQNFILHLALAIDRGQSSIFELDESEKSGETSSDFHDSKGEQIVASICEQLKKKFGIELFYQDRFELTVLCSAEIKSDQNDYHQYINQEIEDKLDGILKEISKVYLLDFSDSQFHQKLMYHIQNLYNRASQNRPVRNFSLMDIKVKYPILFDIAIYMASLLSNSLTIEINEDEIAFLALHIGTFIENKTEQDKKLQAVIVTPSYLQMDKVIISKISEYFSDDLTIKKSYEDFQQIKSSESFDLIITTFFESDIPKKMKKTQMITSIKEFLTVTDINKIRLAIDKIYHKKYVHFLQNIIPIWIPENFYVLLKKKMNREDIMQSITNIFVQNHYVEEIYRAELEAREKLSSTAFPSKIAIPHAIKYDAMKTGLLILHTAEEINWDGKAIELVLALAIKKSDSEIFNKVFPRIIEVVSEEYHVNYLAGSENREQFITRLIDLLSSDGYYSL